MLPRTDNVSGIWVCHATRHTIQFNAHNFFYTPFCPIFQCYYFKSWIYLFGYPYGYFCPPIYFIICCFPSISILFLQIYFNADISSLSFLCRIPLFYEFNRVLVYRPVLPHTPNAHNRSCTSRGTFLYHLGYAITLKSATFDNYYSFFQPHFVYVWQQGLACLI